MKDKNIIDKYNIQKNINKIEKHKASEDKVNTNADEVIQGLGSLTSIKQDLTNPKEFKSSTYTLNIKDKKKIKKKNENYFSVDVSNLQSADDFEYEINQSISFDNYNTRNKYKIVNIEESEGTEFLYFKKEKNLSEIFKFNRK